MDECIFTKIAEPQFNQALKANGGPQGNWGWGIGEGTSPTAIISQGSMKHFELP